MNQRNLFVATKCIACFHLDRKEVEYIETEAQRLEVSASDVLRYWIEEHRQRARYLNNKEEES